MRKILTLLFSMIFLIGLVSSAPLITIDSPVNSTTYGSDSVDLNWDVNETINWCSYNLDSGVNDTSIIFDNWNNWTSDTGISSGIASIDKAAMTVFEKDGTWYLIRGSHISGTLLGYNWTGSTWQSDSAIINGTGDFNTRSFPEVFYKDGTWYMIAGGRYARFGFNWTGTTWQSDSGIISGLGGGESLNPEVFQKDGTWYLFFHSGDGYNWTGSTWQSDSAIINGLTGISANFFTFFEKDETWYAVRGMNTGALDGFNWSGSTWQSDSVISTGLTDIGQYSQPEVFEKDGTFYLLAGRVLPNSIAGFNMTFLGIGTKNTTMTSLSEGSHDVIIYCNNTLGDLGQSSSYFSVDSTAPIITINSPQNITYDTPFLTLDISVNENIDKLWFSTDNGFTNLTFVSPIPISIYREGSTTINVWANDTVGNIGTNSVTFVYQPMFAGEIKGSGTIYNLMRSIGAGLGLFFIYIGKSLPLLIIVFMVVGIIIVIGYTVPKAIRNFNTKNFKF